MRDAALAAIAAAGRPRRAQAGAQRARRRPLAAGAGQPRDRRAAAAGPQGRRASGSARPAARSTRRSPPGRPSCEAERDARVLVEEAVDVTLPWDRAPQGARHPLTTLQERDRRRLRRHGLGGRRGPRGRGRVAQLRRAQLRPGPPGPHRCRTPSASSPADGGLVLRTHTSPVQARTMLDAHAADLRRSAPAGCSAPTSSTRRTPRSSTRSRAWWSTRASRWPTSRARSTTSPQSMFGDGITTRLRPSYFPFTEPSAEVDLVCFVCRGLAPGGRDLPHLQGRGLDRVGRLRHGQPAGAARLRHRPGDATPASRSAWASSGR